MQQFFETLRDGVLIVTAEGKVRFVNAAARRHLSLETGDYLPDGPLQRFAISAMAGNHQIPASMELKLGEDSDLSPGEPATVHVVNSPVGKELILVIQPAGDEHFFRTTVSNFETLFRRECTPLLDDLRHEMASLDEALKTQRASVGNLQDLLGKATSSATRLIETLSRLAELSALSGGEKLLATDRIVVDEWLHRCSSGVAGQACDAGVALKIKLQLKDMAPIYGSSAWLDRAMSECINNAIRFSLRGGQVLIDARPCGAFIRITVRNTGASSLSEAQIKRLNEPFFRGSNAKGSQGLGIGIPLARLIIELHGGHLQISPDIDGFFCCALELPSGRQSAVMRENEAEQLKRYAHDLAQLMKRGRSPALTR